MQLISCSHNDVRKDTFHKGPTLRDCEDKTVAHINESQLEAVSIGLYSYYYVCL